jgi:hypothetical protein
VGAHIISWVGHKIFVGIYRRSFLSAGFNSNHHDQEQVIKCRIIATKKPKRRKKNYLGARRDLLAQVSVLDFSPLCFLCLFVAILKRLPRNNFPAWESFARLLAL